MEVAGSYGLNGKIDVINKLNENLKKIKDLKYNNDEVSDLNKITKLPDIVELNGYQFIIDENGKTERFIPIENEKNYVGYYADIDSDGKVDGVIFADMVAGSIKGSGNQQWINNWAAVYTIPKISANNCKKYYISKESYIWAKTTTSKPVLSSIGEGSDRFYIMSLEDFKTEAYTSFYWYKNALGKMSPTITSTDFEKGNENTGTMISKWNAAKEGIVNNEIEPYEGATQYDQDIWKHIQTIYNNGSGWFIPSRVEWAAFAGELGITGTSSGNYNSIYELSDYYWASSQGSPYHAWSARFKDGDLGNYYVNNTTMAVRLASTF